MDQTLHVCVCVCVALVVQTRPRAGLGPLVETAVGRHAGSGLVEHAYEPHELVRLVAFALVLVGGFPID